MDKPASGRAAPLQNGRAAPLQEDCATPSWWEGVTLPQGGVWLLPTRGRPGALSTVIDACRQYGCPPDLWVLVNRTDPLLAAYEKVPLPPGWRLVRVNADSIHEAVSSVLHNILGLPWVGVINDDLLPATQDWHLRLQGAVTGSNLVVADDGGWHPGRMQSAHVFSGPLLGALGHFYVPFARHMFGDDMWEYLHQETGCVTFLSDVVVRHDHVLLGGRAPDDTTQHANRNMQRDAVAFQKWKAFIAPFEIDIIRDLVAHG